MILNKIKELLLKIKNSSFEEQIKYIEKLQNIIWNDETVEDESLNNILTDIAYIFDFYEPNENWRKEDPSYYGEERLEMEILSAIEKINNFEEE